MNNNKRFTGCLSCTRLCSKNFIRPYSLNPNKNSTQSILLLSLSYRKGNADTERSCPSQKAVNGVIGMQTGWPGSTTLLITLPRVLPNYGSAPGWGKGWRSLLKAHPSTFLYCSLSSSLTLTSYRSCFLSGRKTSSSSRSPSETCSEHKLWASGIQAA